MACRPACHLRRDHPFFNSSSAMMYESEAHFENRLRIWKQERAFQEFRFNTFICSSAYNTSWMNEEYLRREFERGVKPVQNIIPRTVVWLTYPFGIVFFIGACTTFISLDFQNYIVALILLLISLPHLWYTKFLVDGIRGKPIRGKFWSSRKGAWTSSHGLFHQKISFTQNLSSKLLHD